MGWLQSKCLSLATATLLAGLNGRLVEAAEPRPIFSRPLQPVAPAQPVVAEKEPVKQAQKQVEFLRLKRGADNSPLSLDTAVVRYCETAEAAARAGRNKPLEVDLVGAVHLGSRSYYNSLDRLFRNYDAVLYELVAPDNARVPKENLVGPLNGGWAVAKRLLQHERSGMGGSAGGRGRGEPAASLGSIAKKYVGEDEQGRLDDAALRMRIATNDIEMRCIQLTQRRIAEEAKGNAGPSAATSVMKNAFMQAAQDKAELTVEAMGHQGLGWEGDAFTKEEIEAVRTWLGGKAGSIYGGSNEVQNNIVAKRILGLPDLVKAA